MLEVKDINVFYGESQALYDVSLTVKKGEFVTIIGPNGAGKTTIMNTIMGLLKPKSGSIYYNDKDLTKINPWERTNLGISYVPEGRRIFPELTVMENLRVGAYKIKDENKLKDNLEYVFELFPRLEERKKQLAETMSGGEQQMLAIGRALMLSPELILIDEVSMGLMPILVNKVFDVIGKLNKKGITVLLVEQNAAKALNYADRGYLLEVGNIVKADSCKNLKTDEMIKKAYLGG
ncbi:MAG: ABC transporter ATP-binding protein [Halanaerobiales bacterium]|nr:ABC transporter ATP-binding protein [Halanaerobiales bacterium]